jgi:protein-S-isoprenylcysteine O-methyltransferase Ste14
MKLRMSLLDFTSAFASRFDAMRRTKLYDLFAAAPLIAWYLYGAAQLLPLIAQQSALVRLIIQTDASVLPATLVLSLISRVGTLIFCTVLVATFSIRYVPQRNASGFYPRFAGVAGTVLGIGIVLLPPQELSSALYVVSLLMIISGTVFAIYATLVLGRSISILPEARRLVTSGPYAVIRHPLYLGEFVAIGGIALQYLSVWALLLLGLQCVFQFQRMKFEECALCRAFPEYADYMARTARLIPHVY